jgi:hypothetical protein
MLPKLDALKPGAWLGWQCATLEPCFMPSRAKPLDPTDRRLWRVLIPSLVLFGLNALICAPLYRVEYLDQMSSVEGVFIALARYMRDHAGDLYWCPLWFGGMPFQNTYPPLLHALVALVSATVRISPALAYHAVTAFFYCLGPVTLFWLLKKLTGRTAPSFAAGLLYSLFSPSAALLPEIRADIGGLLHARRLQCVVHYGEGPHVASLALIPLAILTLELAFTSRRPIHFFLAVLACMAVVLTNWPGAVALTMVLIAWICSKQRFDILRAAGLVSLVAIVGYAIASPWCPPSTVRVVFGNAQRAGGAYGIGLRQFMWMLMLAIACCALRFVLLRWRASGLIRFSALLTLISGAVIVAASHGKYLLPQPQRFHLLFELAVTILAVFALWPALSRLPRFWSRIGIGVACLLAGVQVWNYSLYGRQLMRPIDIRQTIEYRVADWLNRNGPYTRVFAPGSMSVWLNAFTDTPQLAGCCDQSSPNFESLVAGYTVYTDQNAGNRGAYYSLIWLKAFGVQAIAMDGAASTEAYHPFAHPKKFDGMLHRLWGQGDNEILEVPERTAGLAHVIPETALARRTPVHGLDVAPLLPYIAALDDPALPPAATDWRNQHDATIQARLNKGQLVSVQLTYSKGWHATINGQPREVMGDAIGLLAIRPRCEGDCVIRLTYDGGTEMLVARIASWSMAGLLLAGVLLAEWKRRTEPRP